MAPRLFDVNQPGMPGGRGVRSIAIAIGLLILFLIGNPIRVIPAGHVGVKDLFGRVSSDVLKPGVNLVMPFTKVVKFSAQTQELKESADVPSREGLIMDLEASLLYRLDPTKAADMYRRVGANFNSVVGLRLSRSARYGRTTAGALSSEREDRDEIFTFTRSRARGIHAGACSQKIGLRRSRQRDRKSNGSSSPT